MSGKDERSCSPPTRSRLRRLLYLLGGLQLLIGSAIVFTSEAATAQQNEGFALLFVAAFVLGTVRWLETRWSLRELILITTIFALALGWLLDHQRLENQKRELQTKLERRSREIRILRMPVLSPRAIGDLD